MANLANIGDVVTFHGAVSTTDAGIVTGTPDTTHVVVAYDFALPNGGQIVHSREFTTDAVTVVSGATD